MRDGASPEALAAAAYAARRHSAHILLAAPHAFALCWLYSDVFRLCTVLLLPAPRASADEPPSHHPGVSRVFLAPWRAPYAAARGALAGTPAAAHSAWFLLPAFAFTAALVVQPFFVGGGASAARVLGHGAACAAGLHCAASAAMLEAEDRAGLGGGSGWRWRKAAALGLSAAGAVLFAAGTRGIMPELEGVVARGGGAGGGDTAGAGGELKRMLDWGLDVAGTLAAPLELASTAAGVPLPLEAGVKAAKGFMGGGTEQAAKTTSLTELGRWLWAVGPRLSALCGAGAAVVALAALSRC
jgi:hypothetical protein